MCCVHTENWIRHACMRAHVWCVLDRHYRYVHVNILLLRRKDTYDEINSKRNYRHLEASISSPVPPPPPPTHTHTLIQSCYSSTSTLLPNNIGSVNVFDSHVRQRPQEH